MPAPIKETSSVVTLAEAPDDLDGVWIYDESVGDLVFRLFPDFVSDVQSALDSTFTADAQQAATDAENAKTAAEAAQAAAETAESNADADAAQVADDKAQIDGYASAITLALDASLPPSETRPTAASYTDINGDAQTAQTGDTLYVMDEGVVVRYDTGDVGADANGDVALSGAVALRPQSITTLAADAVTAPASYDQATAQAVMDKIDALINALNAA